MGHFGTDETVKLVGNWYWYSKLKVKVKFCIPTCWKYLNFAQNSSKKEESQHFDPKNDLPFKTIDNDNHLFLFEEEPYEHTRKYIFVIDAFSIVLKLLPTKTTNIHEV